MSSTRIALLFVAAWAGSWVTFAGAQPLDRSGEAFTGTVASADAFKLVLRADNGTLVSFAIEDPAAVPAGLVPGLRITVRYEAPEGEPYRLIGVRIASGPIEGGSTTDPPAQRSSSAIAFEQPAPPLPPVTTLPAASEPAAVAESTQASQASAEPRMTEPAQPVEASVRPSSQPQRQLPSTPAPREVAALAALLVVASLLLWAAYVRR